MAGRGNKNNGKSQREGFFTGLVKSAAMNNIIRNSRDKNGRIDPYKAGGIAAGMGFGNARDMAHFGALLGENGAFDDAPSSRHGGGSGEDGLEEDWRYDYEFDPLYMHLNADVDACDTEEEYLEQVRLEHDEWKNKYDPENECPQIEPECFEDEYKYAKAVEAERCTAWKKTYDPYERFIEVDPFDYADEADYKAAIRMAQEELGAGWKRKYDSQERFDEIDPLDFDEEADYRKAVLSAQEELCRTWRNAYDPNGWFAEIDPQDYGDEWDYEAAVSDAREGRNEEWIELHDPEREMLITASVDPDDYATELEYMQALWKAKEAWQEEEDPDHRYPDISPQDFDGQQEYREAVRERAEEDLLECTEVLDEKIVEDTADPVGRYLTADGDALCAQAVKEHFTLPIELPDEEDSVVTECTALFEEIAGFDQELAMEVWAWCIKTFAPHLHRVGNRWEITVEVMTLIICDGDEKIQQQFLHQLERDPAFVRALYRYSEIDEYDIDWTVTQLLKKGKIETAEGVISACMENEQIPVIAWIRAVDGVLEGCEEIQMLDAFEQRIYPIILGHSDRLRKQQKKWENVIAQCRGTLAEQDEEEEEAEEAESEETVESEGSQEPEVEIRREDYPSTRLYETALELKSLLEWRTHAHEADIARCRFILDHQEIPAARYLTSDGEILFAQAIRENMHLPVEISDGMAERETDFSDLFEEFSGADVSMAMEMWALCVNMFIPYRQYANSYSLSEILDASIPPNLCEEQAFYDALCEHIARDERFVQLFFANTEMAEYEIAEIVVGLLKREMEVVAEDVWSACLDNAKQPAIWQLNLTERILEKCMREEGLLEQFQRVIYPIILEKSQRLSLQKVRWDREITLCWQQWEEERQREEKRQLQIKQDQEKKATFLQRQKAMHQKAQETEPDAEFICIQVEFEPGGNRYSYLTQEESLRVNQNIYVPVGGEGLPRRVTVKSIAALTKEQMPFPFERMKWVEPTLEEE